MTGSPHLLLGSIGDVVVAAAPFVGPVVAAGAILGYLRRTYRLTVGRRRQAYARLQRLGVNAHLGFFEAVLGEPPAIRRTVVKDDYRSIVYSDDPRFDPALVDDLGVEQYHDVREPQSFLECVFVDRDFFVQAVSDDDGTVLAFSVTTRSGRFNPVFSWPPRLGWRERRRISKLIGEKYEPLFRVRLGRTRFSEFGDAENDQFAGPRLTLSLGAHNYTYSEFESFGNPGGYQSFVFTTSDVARGPMGDMFAASKELSTTSWPQVWPPADGGDHRRWDDLQATRRFRRETVVMTITIISMDLWDENYPTTYGPRETWVRTLP